MDIKQSYNRQVIFERNDTNVVQEEALYNIYSVIIMTPVKKQETTIERKSPVSD